MTTNQTDFLKRIRTALGHPASIRRQVPELYPQQPTAQSVELLDRIRMRGSDEHLQLLAQMKAAGRPINLKVTLVDDEAAATKAIIDAVRLKSPEWKNQIQVATWQHPL